ncbi:AraC family transcriptional regulator [Paenibacillus spongiae]|uniref:AraC family transcriptional regulator n=1 Tax=Paenibacillus spongiae TaxID=2909671 RepID=A0ABY5S5U6_9BACL|nr:AraC family transcriptional regulator [Paenibacillus spongiae]UVI28242.1 AraC family transcriptional regulator [Paenibacillus spongiae]
MEERIVSRDYLKELRFPFYIMRCTHNANNVPKMHSHEFVELVYVIKGEALHCFEGDVYPLKAGDVFIINPNENHTFEFSEGQEIEIVNCLFLPDLIHDACLRELGVDDSMDYFYVLPFLSPDERFHHRLKLSERETSAILQLLEYMMHEWDLKRTGYTTLIRLKLVELFIQLSRIYKDWVSSNRDHSKRRSNHLLVQRINGFLERHYDEKLCVTDLGEMFNISNRQLNRVFKQETGLTVVERVHHIRIEHAKQMLMESEEKVLHVAQKVGYDDPAFFSHLFRRYVGCSPGKFRGHGK